MVILATTWSDGAAMLRVRRGDARDSSLEPLAGFALNYRVSDDLRRVCIGHVPFRKGRGTYHDCVNEPEAAGRRCERCMIVEATFASNLHHAHTRGSAELDPSIAAHLQQPNQLYLAAFRDGSLKIGTTTEQRRDTRLAEQGAWRALIVADADDGFIVREIEDLVTEELALVQAVHIRRKIAGLVSPRPDDQLDAQLRRSAARVRELVEQMNSDRLRALSEPQPWAHPTAAELRNTKLLDYPLRLDHGSHDLVLQHAVGRVAIASRSGGADRFALDLQPLFGVELELGDFESDEIAIQDSLF